MLFAGLAYSASAQSEKEDLAIAQSLFGKAKKSIITEHIRLSEQEEAAFWKLYDEYETKAMQISAERLKLIDQYASQYNSLSDDQATILATAYLDNSSKYTALYKDYLKKFTKQIGGTRAATLIQVEIYIQTAIQAYLQQQIPVIGELKKE